MKKKEAKTSAEVETSEPKKRGRPVKLRGKMVQLNLAFPPSLIDEIDERAGSLNISRANYIRLVLSQFLSRQEPLIIGATHEKTPPTE